MDADVEDQGLKKPGAPKGSYLVKLSDDKVADVAIDVLLAGYETTANTLSFLFYLLALHPEIQEKLQAEIESYFEQKPVRVYNVHSDIWFVYTGIKLCYGQDGSLYDAALEIKYLDMVIQEALRLYPVGPRLTRLCSNATTINNIHIPVNSHVIIPTHIMHSDPKYWEEPDKFDPTR